MSQQRAQSASSQALIHVLSDMVILSLKVRNYHWNVKGPHFLSLHQLFEEIYSFLEEASDTLAERLSFLSGHVPASASEYLLLTVLKEEKGQPKDVEMLSTLHQDLKTLQERMQGCLTALENPRDDISLDLIIENMTKVTHYSWKIGNHLC